MAVAASVADEPGGFREALPRHSQARPASGLSDYPHLRVVRTVGGCTVADVVGIAQLLVALAMTLAGLLGGVAEQLPGTIPDGVPAVCVPLPLPVGGGGLQAGYCP